MIKSLLICCLLVGLGSSSMAGVTQDDLASIENSIKRNEPAWALSAKEVQPSSTIYRWKAGQQAVVTEIFLTASNQEASGLLEKFALRVPVPPKEKPKGLGDEALLFQTADTGGGMILFRKGNAFILITGSSMADERRFAKHIAGVILDK